MLTLCFAVIFISISFGVIIYILSDSTSIDLLVDHFVRFAENTKRSSKIDLLINLLSNNIPYIFLMLVLGTSIIGSPLILIISLVKCMGISFLNSMIITHFGLKGVEYILLVQLPGKFIYLFSVLLIMNVCTESSLKIKQASLGDQKESLQLKKYFIKILTVAAFFVLSSLIDFIGISVFSSLFNFE